MLYRILHYFIVSLFVLLALAVNAQDDEKKLEQLRLELEGLNEKLQEYQGKRDNIQSELRKQELELSQIHKRIHETDQSILQGQSKISGLQQQAEELEADRNRQELQLREDLRTMYQTGTEEPLKMLLNQNNPAEFSRMLNYYQYLLEARADTISSYLETIGALDDTQSEILHQQGSLKQLSNSLAKQEEALASAQANRVRLLKEIESRILSAEQLIAQKEEDREKLEQLITEVEERIASLAPPESYKPFASLKGQYSWPVDGNFAHRYGTTRSGTLRWQGVVINSPSGDPVKTIHYGRVVFADYLRGYGLLVIVDHGDDYLTLYGHNQSLFVEPGDWVIPGDQIALVGNSGGIAEQGLYFEIRYQGKPQNPAAWATR